MIDPATARRVAEHCLETVGGRAADGDERAAAHELLVRGRALADPRAAAMPDELLAALVAGGLVERNEGGYRAVVRLSTWEGLVVAHDPMNGDETPHPDVVGPVNPTTRTLAALTVRRRVRTALDVGTGCGAHALLAARHADHVVATDVNPRALWFTELNARLNGFDNIECRAGSMFEPVAGERFDLVVANLPFVVSPDTAYTYRDSGLPADEISRLAIQQAAAALEPDGYAHLLGNWLVEDESDVWSRPLAWLDGSSCSAWVLHHRTESSREYAEKWNRDLLRREHERYADTVDRWVDYHRGIGATAIANGAFVLCADGAGTRRTDRMQVPPAGDGGAQAERALDAELTLAARDVDDLVVAPVSPHSLHQTLRHRGGGYQTADAKLVIDDDTTGVVGEIDPTAIHVFLRLDGVRSLRDVVRVAERETGLPVDDLVDAGRVMIVELARQGLLSIH